MIVAIMKFRFRPIKNVLHVTDIDSASKKNSNRAIVYQPTKPTT
jgi:hypothetical protein